MYIYSEIITMIVVGACAGFINVVAGGGSTLSVPLLMMLGLDPHIANATNRIPVLCQTFSSAYVLNRKKNIDFKKGVFWGLIMVPGAVLGVYFSFRISALYLKLAIMCAVVVIALISVFPERKYRDREILMKKYPYMIPIALFLMGFYGGFIQMGVGFMFIALMRSMTDFSLLKINQYKVFTVSIYMLPVVIAFAMQGAIDWSYAIVLSLGFFLGSIGASKMALKKGDVWIKKVYFLALGLIVIKMIYEIMCY